MTPARSRTTKRSARIALLACGLIASASLVSAATNDSSERLTRALDAYARAQGETDRDARRAGFQQAEQGFAALIAAGHESPELYTNLGNAALQAGRIGEAVLAYQRALRIEPTAVTAQQNLAHVRSLLPSWVPRPSGVEARGVMNLDRRIPAAQRSLAAAACFAAMALALVVAGRRPAGPWRGFALVLGAAWLLLLASVVAGEGRSPARLAVLTAEATPARSSDSALAPLAFPDPLPSGVEVELLEERGEFARVRLANGRDVWVRASGVTPVAG